VNEASTERGYIMRSSTEPDSRWMGESATDENERVYQTTLYASASGQPLAQVEVRRIRNSVTVADRRTCIYGEGSTPRAALADLFDTLIACRDALAEASHLSPGLMRLHAYLLTLT
jgi:hypothetical protein